MPGARWLPIADPPRYGAAATPFPGGCLLPEWLRPLAARLGVTRLADVTGLDRVGIPVVMAIRPASRMLVVSQGKGLTVVQAATSAVMEACESWCAERPGVPLLHGREAEVARLERIVETGRLPVRRAGRYRPDRPMLWARGVDLLAGGEPKLVPWPLVHTDYVVDPPPPGAGCFCASSNGLGAGPDRDSAIVQALFEVIERDASTLFELRPPAAREALRIAPSSVDDPDCTMILGRLTAAGLRVGIWNTTADTGLPSFHVELAESRAGSAAAHPITAAGAGCAAARGEALRRALLEAVQSRLTVISGSRDDMLEPDYLPAEPWWADDRRGIPFAAVPDHDASTPAHTIRLALERLARIRVDEVVVVDLSSVHALGIDVVRVVVPGLETMLDHPHYEAGPRARAVLAGRA